MEKPDFTEISMGFQTGIYAVAQMIQAGFPTDEISIEALKQTAAGDLYKITGMPAEDFSSIIDRMMADMVARINKMTGEKYGK